jgi:hypothetical protein
MTFRKLDLFPSSSEVRKTSTLLDPLERERVKLDSFLRAPTEYVFPSHHLRTERNPISKNVV